METPQQFRVKQMIKRTNNLWDKQDQPRINKSSVFLSASVICGDPLNYKEELRELELGNIDMLHIDVMDGVFVPRLGQHPELVQSIRKKTNLPIDIHLMMIDPEPFIPIFAEAGADIIVVHSEISSQPTRLFSQIRNYGCRPGIAINPATPIESLHYLVDEVDLIMLMAINPGSSGEKMKPVTLQKISQVKKLLKDRHQKAHILIDGNTTLENATKMVQAGATILVSGTSSIYRQPQGLKESIHLFRTRLAENLNNI